MCSTKLTAAIAATASIPSFAQVCSTGGCAGNSFAISFISGRKHSEEGGNCHCSSPISVHLNKIHMRKITEIDRKSTRLNSSHTVISYAVFCLKKKNITTTACMNCDACKPTED